MLFHPTVQIVEHAMDVSNSILQECRSHHRDIRARHHGFQDIDRAVYAPGDRQARPNVAVDDRHPMQPREQLMRLAQMQPGHNLQRFDVEIGLIETVEENQRIGPGAIQPFGNVRNRAEIGREFHRNGNAYANVHTTLNPGGEIRGQLVKQ